LEIQFRNIKKQDIENMLQMCAETGYETRYETLSAKVSDIIKNKNSVIIVAVDDENKPAGWIQLEVSNFIFSERTCNILGLFVDKKYRGRRIGKKLLEKAAEWAKANNCIGLEIYSDITRIDSHEFYKHLDFKHIKTQQNFYKSMKFIDKEQAKD